MARKPSGISAAGSPITKDNLRLIKGIGPVFSKRLYDAGILTYVQLASLSAAELSQIVDGLSVKHSGRQDWAGQARKLASGNKQFRHPKEDAPNQTLHQHYENFTIEFLLGEKNKVQRTHLVHIQSGDSDTWAGWEADQIFDFLVRHTGGRIPSKQLHRLEISTSSKHPPKSSSSTESEEFIKVTPSSHLQNKHKREQSDTTLTRLTSNPPTISDFAGILYIQDMIVIPIDAEVPICSLRQNQPYRVRFTIIRKDISFPDMISLKSKVTINFKGLTGDSHLVAEEYNNIKFSDRLTLDINCTSPPPGLYRPSVLVKLFYSAETETGLMATSKGDLIQVI